jgi:hypothetical protein
VRIEFTRRGGFAGITVCGAVDAADLSAEESAGLEALGRIRRRWTSAVRDAFEYTVALDDGERRREYSFSDLDVPDELWPLIARLAAVAGPGQTPGL